VTDPQPYDHLRSTDADDDDAIYRVVGRGVDSVVVLRVADADGRRAHTGEVITIPSDVLSTFEHAENPDGNQPIGAKLSSIGTNAYWSFRAVAENLAGSPLFSLLALSLFALGRFGAEPLSLSESLSLLLELTGILALAAVGSGRLSQ